MLDKQIIISVEGKKSFGRDDLYRIYMDCDDIADNLVRKWKSEVRNALYVSASLVAKIEEVYKLGFIDEDDINEFDAETALNSQVFNGYLA